METFYYARLTLLGYLAYMLASTKGLMLLSTEQTSDVQFFAEIKKRFNIEQAQCDRSEEQLFPYIEALSRYSKGSDIDLAALPLDLRGTPFQLSVWQALCHIPHGTTTYYSAISEAIDNVKAVRAVGRAIGANPILLFVPCHRVIGKNGTLTGFSAGLPLKQRLLEHESQSSSLDMHS